MLVSSSASDDVDDPASAMLRRFVLASGVLFGGLLGTGGFLLHQQWSGWIGLSVLILSIWQLRRGVAALPS